MATKSKAKTKHFWDMTLEEREKAVKEFDKPLAPERIKPLSKKGRQLWERAQRVGDTTGDDGGTRAITVELDATILKRSDEYARSRGMTLDELVNRSLKSALTFVENETKGDPGTSAKTTDF